MMTDSTPGTAAVSIRGITKTFTGQRALDDVTLDIPAGQVTALLGMNGSGKSTLIKILAGVYDPDPGGELEIRGESTSLPLTPDRAHAAGLRFLHQDLGLVDMLTVADNFALSDGFVSKGFFGVFAPINRRQHRDHAAATLRLLDIDVDPDGLVRDLSPTDRTMVGIARAFQSNEGGVEALRRNVLVLDEPTASLPAEDSDRVLELVDRLRSHGGTAIYVSHRIEEVIRIADHVAVLRDGRLVADEVIGEGRTTTDLVSLVVGRQLEHAPIRAAETREGTTLLEMSDVTGRRLRNLDLSVRSGEILGVTGLVGCGRSELVRVLVGTQRPQCGTMTLDGQPYAPHTPADAVAAGVGCVPQDRRREGVILDLSVAENLTLGRLEHFVSGPAINLGKEQEHIRQLISDYVVKTSSPSAPVRSLSGGNQQKVVVARAASFHPRLLLLDEPSQGVDALAKQEIANLLRRLADSGVAILIASTDYDDFPGLADRVVILDRGHVAGELNGDEITEDHVALACQRTSAA